jgi:hypothetical protein
MRSTGGSLRDSRSRGALITPIGFKNALGDNEDAWGRIGIYRMAYVAGVRSELFNSIDLCFVGVATADARAHATCGIQHSAFILRLPLSTQALSTQRTSTQHSALSFIST